MGLRYGGVVALDGVDLHIHRGEVLAVCGGNGAGKSSLIRIVSGAQRPSSGRMERSGRPVAFRSPHDALRAGIATIYQDLALAPRLSIAENVFMGAEPTRFGLLRRRRMHRMARDYLARLVPVPPDPARPVAELSGGQRQAVAISRALHWNAEVIVMDEPTAALGVAETAQVLDLIRRLSAEGRTVVLVSHAMHDIVALADRVVVLRAGRKVEDRPMAGLDAGGLSRLIAA